MNAMCDDFENIDQIILPEVARDCAKLGFSVERAEIVKTVSELVEDGLAKAYDLSGTIIGMPFSGELQGMPPVDIVEEDFKTYFYLTKKGMDFHLSDDTWWPFDDDDNVLPNWHLDPPTEVWLAFCDGVACRVLAVHGRRNWVSCLFGERRNIGIVDHGGVRTSLPICHAVQRRFLAFTKGLVPDRFGVHADLLPGPR